MKIEFSCTCGARFRVDERQAGRKARCKRCGLALTVPRADQPVQQEVAETLLEFADDEKIRLFDEQHPQTDRAAPRYSEELGQWLTSFGSEEYVPRSDRQPPEPLKFDDEDAAAALAALEEQSRPAQTPDTTPPPFVPPSADQVVIEYDDDAPVAPKSRSERDWIIDAKRTFWGDLAYSFVFMFNPDNLVAFLVLPFIVTIMTFAFSLLGYAALAGSILILIICISMLVHMVSYLLNVMRTTASGEDCLPDLSYESLWDGLFGALAEFACSFLLALVPAGIGAGLMWWRHGEIDYKTITGLMLVGAFFWPAIILCVGIGQGISGLWPHLIIRTALAAPVAYLAIGLVLVVSGAISALPYLPFLEPLLDRLSIHGGTVFYLICRGVTIYGLVVSMRAIGLYYRHFKERFPWTAE